MRNFIKKHITKIIFIILIILQVCVIVYATSEREHMHIDEYFSFGFISSEKMLIHNETDFYNTWHNPDYFYEYLEISEDEQKSFKPVYENQKNDVHPPLYYLLLRIFSNFNIDNFSIWTGIVLNIILFIISMCIVYLIGQKLFNNKKYSLLLCALVGFNIGIIQIAIYIRMYQLLILSSLLLIYWHLCKKDKEKLGFKDCLQLLLIVCMGFLTQYYFSILAVGLYVVHFVRKIKAKQFKEILKYTITLILAVGICTFVFPYWVDHLLNSGRGKEAFDYISTRPQYFFIIGALYVDMLNRDIFNYLFYGLLGVFACLIIYNLYCKIKEKNVNKDFNIKEKNKKKQMGMSYIIFPTIFYFVLVTFVSPYIEIRYFSPIIVPILIIVLYYLKVLGEKVFNDKKYCFIIISLISFITIFMSAWRYNNNLFTYKQDEVSMQKVMDNSHLNLIYICNVKDVEMYNSYHVFLNYENTICIKNNKNIAEEIISIINDRNLEKQDYVIGIDKSIYAEVTEKLNSHKEFEDLRIDFIVGNNGFMINK